MIKEATIDEVKLLAELAIKMWNQATIEELTKDFEEIVKDSNKICFIKYINKEAVGFAYCGKRTDYVEGTSSSPVGYLEGIYILEKHRRCGLALELLQNCETWAKKQGCKEFASDCELNNHDSLAFHLATGFEEANRIICFRKDI